MGRLKGQVPRGKDHPNWKGGIQLTKFVRGRHRTKRRKGIPRRLPAKRIYVDGKYIKESRLVMERHINRKLIRKDVVHHINGNTLDNRIENLFLTDLSKHTKIHFCSAWRLFWDFCEEKK